MNEEINNQSRENLKVLIILNIIIILLYTLVDAYALGIGCHTKSIFSNDKYCQKIPTSNDSYSLERWVMKNHEQDRIDTENYQKYLENIEKERLEKEKCYNAGYLVNDSFTIEDYGFNCKKIDYLNNHLMDNYQKVDAGNIKGEFGGIFSFGYISGNQYAYINERVLASGKLIENINFWVDCNNITHNEQVNYYTEEEFVMYYVKECIN